MTGQGCTTGLSTATVPGEQGVSVSEHVMTAGRLSWRVSGIVLTIVVLHVLGWGTFFAVVRPQRFAMDDGATVFGVGLAITAYLVGVRHAFDADHIAAIDNTTRKLATAGRSPASTGFWFALGHSTVVILTVALLSAGLNLLAGQLRDDGSVLQQFTGIWGPAVSGLFLLLIGMINLVSLAGVRRAHRRLKAGTYDGAEFDALLDQRGLLNRLVGPLARRIDQPWKMYPLGVLFGLGFDTATTIGLFVVAGGAAVTLPWYAVMVLPLLFTAGMVLFDSLDGLLMSRVYRWAFQQPARKILYNYIVTSVSVAIAFTVALVILGGLVSALLHVDSGPLAWIGGVDLENFGLVVVGLFAMTWVAAVIVGNARKRT